MSTIDELLANTPEPQKQELGRIRKIVSAECPEAKEVMAYGMPGYKYKDKYLLSFANFKDHMSLFPGAEPVDVLAKELEPYRTSKGTIQFSLEHTLSDELITKIVLLCKNRIDTKAN